MKSCGFAGGQCPREATATARVAMIGDRHLCSEHLAWMQAQGMDLRVLEPNAFVPEWRTRGLARDLTGRVMDHGRVTS